MSGVGMSGSAGRVQKALEEFGVGMEVVELEASTRTSEEAARAVGCDVAQIAKSLVFRGAESGRAILVVASGAHRVDEGRLAGHAGEPVKKADADFVREWTGYSIGGVPPVGHARRIAVFVDRDLLSHSEIWAAAGTPHAVFRLSPGDLVRITGGRVVDVL